MIAEQDCSEPDWENYEPDSYYEPDEEDFAYMIAQEREVASLRSEYHDADGSFATTRNTQTGNYAR